MQQNKLTNLQIPTKNNTQLVLFKMFCLNYSLLKNLKPRIFRIKTGEEDKV